nr:helix-turn-helix domain-containing protein [Enterococcus sp. 669A]
MQRLNYEVFSSVAMLKQMKNNPNWLQIIQSYQAIIFSETLTNEEIRELLIFVDFEDNLLVRKFNREPLTQEKEVMYQLGIATWVCDTCSLDFLREQFAVNLASCQKNENQNIVFLYQKDESPRTLTEFKGRLTKKERKTFECLLGSEDGIISRESMCQYIWEEPPNNSRLTQLSVLVKRLKAKLHEAGFQDEMIDTVWGYGYRLSPKLLQFYNQEMTR